MNVQTVTQKALPILKKHGVVRASLFGSVLKNNIKNYSDIDILVELPNTVHGFDYVALKLDLQDELESVLGRPVDIVEYNLIKPSLKKYILPTQKQIL